MWFILLSQINHHYLFSFSGCWCTEWRNGSQRNIISYSYPYDILYSNTFRFSPSRANPPRHNRGTMWLCLTCLKQEKNIVEQHFILKKQIQPAWVSICLNILYKNQKNIVEQHLFPCRNFYQHPLHLLLFFKFPSRYFKVLVDLHVAYCVTECNDNASSLKSSFTPPHPWNIQPISSYVVVLF